MQIFGFGGRVLPEIVIFFARGEIDPFRLAASRQATFPKGTAFGGGDKVSGSAQRRPLGGAGERSEPEGVPSPLVFIISLLTTNRTLP